MEGVLDVERDHGALIDACGKLLAPGGLLVFSTNAQRFKLDDALEARYDIRDISGPTLPRDFERNRGSIDASKSDGIGAKLPLQAPTSQVAWPHADFHDEAHD